ncbi:uncharacterized protein LOC129961411 [Argiope bruennichi]|uniref:DUF19 domain-containing protein n=1 Tax=Argiope bruennichi TaxID=94029 RepID=A0A8T0FYP3_ARGBR|nr:uncharacterized protein LOC129961411 [Argiope bruennichi]KAF8795385.1 hypothetical protein HNY73_003238 [Argiope bruennichi]
MNKLLFILLLGIATTTASPTCSQEESLKCGSLGDKEWIGKTWPENEIELNKACSDVEQILDCQIAFIERCPTSEHASFLGYLKESKVLYGKLCVESDFRTKFLRNVPCLNHEVQDIYNVCGKKFTVEDAGGFCAYNFAVLQCVLNDITKKCGEESLHVFNGLYQPMLSLDKVFCRRDD